jgi:glycolate oxidase iron-sulfur subunit
MTPWSFIRKRQFSLTMCRPATIDDIRLRVQQASAQCVACGLCLPHCPTYQLATNEAESPRGRIAMLAATANGDLPADQSLARLLDHCLVCRSCEKHCPSGVPFGSLMDNGRALVRLHSRGNWLRELSLKAIDISLRNADALRRIGNLASHFVRPAAGQSGTAGAPAPAALVSRLRSYASMLRRQPGWPARIDALPDEPARGRVSLFLGCVARSLDGNTLNDAIEVLRRFGFGIDIPTGQGCCGALPLHAGRQSAAQRLMQQNMEAFMPFADQPLLFTASGCGAALCDYPAHLADGQHALPAVLDICQFLDMHWPKDLRPPVSNNRVLLHTPCSLANNLPDPHAAMRLLARLPGLDLHESSSDYHCCGSAGNYMLSNPQTAAQLRAPVIEQAGRLLPDFIVTSNIGCAMHLAEGLQRSGLDIPVMHPVSLLAASLAGTSRQPAEVPTVSAGHGVKSEPGNLLD